MNTMRALQRLGLVMALWLPTTAIAEVFKYDVPLNYQGIPDGEILGNYVTGNVSGLGTNVVDRVTVSLKIQGNTLAYNGDLYVTLVHMDSGRKAVLLNRVGAPMANYGLGYGDNGFDVTLDDQATNGDVHVYQNIVIPSFGSPITGTWEPDGRDVDPYHMLANAPRTKLLEQFKGLNPNGKWLLFLADLSAAGDAKLVHWELDIKQAGEPQTTNAPSIVISNPPADQIVGTGSDVIFNVSATGSGLLGYRWKKNGEEIEDGGRIIGATSPTLRIRDAQVGDEGAYSVMLSDNNGSLSTAPASLRVLDPPAIVGLSQNVATNLGAMVTFEPSVHGSAPLSFRWLFNGADLAGATNNLLTLTNIQASQAGSYSAIVLNPVGSATGQVAQLTVLFSLEAKAAAGGTVIVNPSQTSFAANTTVELSGRPDPGFVFVGWSGDLAGTSNPVTFVMDGNKIVIGEFKPLRIVTWRVLGQGTVVPIPSATNYMEGTTIQVLATPAQGWQFVQWTGDLDGTQNPISLTLDSDKAVQAVFKQLFIMNLSVVGQGAIKRVPADTNYLDGNVVTAFGVPAEGYRFAGWGGDLGGTNSPQQMLMTTNRSIAAFFVPVLEPIPNQAIDEGVTLSFLVTGTNPPPVTFVFSLEPPVPAGATISTNGVFKWTPNEGDGPTTNTLLVKVSDRDFPSQTAANTFLVIVNEVNTPPRLTVPPAQTIDALSLLVLTNRAIDSDWPANTLTFALVSGPAGMVIDPASGVLTWTPSEAQADRTNIVFVKVSDDGIPNLSDINSFVVVVKPKTPPPAPNILGVSRDDTGLVTLRWQSIAGMRYRMEAKDRLTDTTWTSLGEIQAKDALSIFTERPDNQTQRFYRVVMLY